MSHTTTATSLTPPADSPYAFTVGAVNWATNALEGFSSRGPTEDGRLKPDISAPDGVCTTTYGKCGGDGFLGTSAASPHVAGAVVLVRQVYPLRSATEIRSFLTSRAVDVSSPGPDNETGAGRLALGSTSDADLLPAPTLTRPSGTGAPIWPTYQWSEVAGATSYRLMVAASAAALPADPAVQTCSGCVLNTTTSNAFFTPPVALLAATPYYWQVQGRAAGKNGVWSARGSFATGILPELTQPERTDLPEETGVWAAPAPRAIVITHGWMANTQATSGGDQQWVKEMADKVCGKLAATKFTSTVRANALTKICQSNGWDVWVVDWSSKASAINSPLPSIAFGRASTIGEMLARNFELKRYSHVHFIAHSAGSNLINSATNQLKIAQPAIAIQDTFLDAYEPASDATLYGAKADWTDNYVDTRSVFNLHLGFDGTQMFLTHGYNFDVTPGGADPCNAAFIPPICRHSRPYRFYGRSVDASFVGDADYARYDPLSSLDGKGYPLSLESGRSLSSLRAQYTKGDGCLMTGTSCVPQPRAEDQRFNVVRIARTVSAVVGAVKWLAGFGTTVLFDSIKLGVVSLAAAPPATTSIAPSADPTESPSYIVAEVTTTEPVNKMRYTWRFGTAGEGFLRVFVDGMLVREIDQRFVPSASSEPEEIYIGGANGTLPPGTHRIVFRLDGFGSSASGMELTRVELGTISPSASRRRVIRH
jgi:hypothetical protein